MTAHQKEEMMLSRSLAFAFVLAGANTAIVKMPANSGDLKWEAAPPNLPKGADIAVLSGDPSKEGLFVLRLKMPSGYKIPAHNHPTDEGATVISGNFHIGMGDKLDETNAIELTAGGYAEATRPTSSAPSGRRGPWSCRRRSARPAQARR